MDRELDGTDGNVMIEPEDTAGAKIGAKEGGAREIDADEITPEEGNDDVNDDDEEELDGIEDVMMRSVPAPDSV